MADSSMLTLQMPVPATPIDRTTGASLMATRPASPVRPCSWATCLSSARRRPFPTPLVLTAPSWAFDSRRTARRDSPRASDTSHLRLLTKPRLPWKQCKVPTSTAVLSVWIIASLVLRIANLPVVVASVHATAVEASADEVAAEATLAVEEDEAVRVAVDRIPPIAVGLATLLAGRPPSRGGLTIQA